MAILNKSDLAAEVGQQSGLGNGEATLAVEKVFELIAGRLAAGDEVNVAGYGKFSVTARAARQGRNPQTGETIQIAASNALRSSRPPAR
jgi:DNA-binding protein HU-beta